MALSLLLQRRENIMQLPLMFGTLGLPELLIILFILFLIFGASKLPQLGSGLGAGIKNFKRAIKGDEELPPKGSDENDA
jgi:sec-independent protein translocase protein TatA